MARPRYLLKDFYYLGGELYYMDQTSGRAKNNGQVGSHKKGCYTRVKIGGIRYPVHRIVWEMFYGPIPDNMFIDHINGVKHDNRIENLRLATNQQNQFNRPAKNISWCKQTQKWRVQLVIKNKTVVSKRFNCFGEAQQYAIKQREALHGEFVNHRET